MIGHRRPSIGVSEGEGMEQGWAAHRVHQLPGKRRRHTGGNHVAQPGGAEALEVEPFVLVQLGRVDEGDPERLAADGRG